MFKTSPSVNQKKNILLSACGGALAKWRRAPLIPVKPKHLEGCLPPKGIQCYLSHCLSPNLYHFVITLNEILSENSFN